MARKEFGNPPPEWEGVVIEFTRTSQHGRPVLADDGSEAILVRMSKDGQNLGWKVVRIRDYLTYNPRLLASK